MIKVPQILKISLQIKNISHTGHKVPSKPFIPSLSPLLIFSLAFLKFTKYIENTTKYRGVRLQKYVSFDVDQE